MTSPRSRAGAGAAPALAARASDGAAAAASARRLARSAAHTAGPGRAGGRHQGRGCGGAAAAAAGARRRCCCSRWGWAACSPPKAGTGARAGRGSSPCAGLSGAERGRAAAARREGRKVGAGVSAVPAARRARLSRGRAGGAAAAAAAMLREPLASGTGRGWAEGAQGKRWSCPGRGRREQKRCGSPGPGWDRPRCRRCGGALADPQRSRPLPSPCQPCPCPELRSLRCRGDFLPLFVFFSLALFPCGLGLAFETQVLET